ncbi:aquaporin 12 [Corythoichthys intestinalis]|uniref:aquaporin 12 n=1 Tax=Corythoichthys intestinalis TaxID=161448 RepID=UPI0025A66FC5|nr:aquaporin 12 [Corythoichthys intestinalis]XP_061790797.1 aquaporin-12-like [Nerophis lumbriciformis]
MSGLNASLGYFLSCVALAAMLQAPLKKWPRLAFLSELASSFALVACRLEVQTIVEVGEWAGGLGPDVTLTILLSVLLVHGAVCGDLTGNPCLSVMRFLQLDAAALATVLAVVCHFLGAHLAIVAAEYYWSLELTDMHMIKNLMARECSTSLLVSPLQGFFTEGVCAFLFHLVHLVLRRRTAFIRVPLGALLLTFLSHTAKSHTSAFVNPSLAYGLTFNCTGFTFSEYAVVYWLAPITGMMVALLLYMGHIPRIFAKNLLYFHKTRLRVRKGEKEKKK